MDAAGTGQIWHPLWFGLGAVIAIMIGAALGGSFVRERGRRVLPVVVGCTIVFAFVLGWALNIVLATFYAPRFHG